MPDVSVPVIMSDGLALEPTDDPTITNLVMRRADVEGGRIVLMQIHGTGATVLGVSFVHVDAPGIADSGPDGFLQVL